MAPTADWDEIKRLAADFQKAQLSSTVQRLSERNCIEIVSKLLELKLLDVIFTSDGKEYLTPQQLVKEIREELFVHGGRINIVDVAKELNVDLNQINAHVPEVIKGKDVQLVSGYLIAHYYLEKVAGEINEKLQLQGQISVGELTLLYDLPAELLQHNILERYLNKIIFGKQDISDPRIFYTEEYITRTKAKIRGALMGLLKPTPVAVIINHCNLSDRLFLNLFDQLSAPGILTGRQAGALYVPSCYTKSQNDWVISFYKQNNYLEYDALSRLGISDPKSFIKRILATEELIYLSSCAIGILIQQQLETALEECVASQSYLDIVSLLPSILSEVDIENILESLLKNSKSTVLFDNTVFSNHYLEELKKACMPLTQKKSEAIVKSGKYHQYCLEQQVSKTDSIHAGYVDHKAERKEERRRKAGAGKGGGGAQGRETKTKAVKKHSRSSKHAAQESDSDEGVTVTNKKNQMALEIVTIGDIEKIIKEPLENEGLDELVLQIAVYLHGSLNQTALSIAKELAYKLLQDASQNRKQTHSSAQDRINILVNDIKLYEKGLKSFAFDQQPQFIKYLLKTFGGDVLSEFCKYVASQCNMSVGDSLTVEQRNKIIKDLPEEFMKPLQALNITVSDANLEAFYQAVDSAISACEMILKKADKKKDKILIQNHREKLISELESCEDPALTLHLSVLTIFTILTQNMLHASGRQVPTIISHLKTQMKEEDYEHIQLYHDLVTKYLTGSDEEKLHYEEKLKLEMPLVKKIVVDIKKYK